MRRPNILLITDDQHRGDCLGIEGHPVLSTPNLDWVGASGTHFRRCYSEVPSCIAARRILLTGMNQDHTGLVGYRDHLDWDPPQTVGGLLAAAGYQTQLCGKLHMAPKRKRYGFQNMVWSDGYGGGCDYEAYLVKEGQDEPQARLSHGIDVNGWVGRPWHLEERYTHTYWAANESIRFLETRDPSCPFFLHFSMVDPHPPLTPPRFYYDRYMELDLPEPVIGDWAPDVPNKPGARTNSSFVNLDPQTMRRCRAAYYGMVNHVDDQIGRVLQALNRCGLEQDTLVIFSSDHGEMLGDHHLFRKSVPYEGSARVPLVARAPRWMGCPEEVTSDLPIGWQDITPTILDAAGVDIPDTVDGRSFLPIMRGEMPAWRDHLHIEHTGHAYTGHAICDGQEKYVWLPSSGTELLFDLVADPDELHDLSQECPERVAAGREKLIEHLKDRVDSPVEDGELVAGKRRETVLPNGGVPIT